MVCYFYLFILSSSFPSFLLSLPKSFAFPHNLIHPALCFLLSNQPFQQSICFSLFKLSKCVSCRFSLTWSHSIHFYLLKLHLISNPWNVLNKCHWISQSRFFLCNGSLFSTACFLYFSYPCLLENSYFLKETTSNDPNMHCCHRKFSP